MKIDFVTVLTVDQASDLLVAQSLLDDAGIENEIADLLINQLNPLYANAVGGIKLKVSRENYFMAYAILKDAGFIKENTVDRKTLQHRITEYWFNSKLPAILILGSAIFLFGALIWVVNNALRPSLKEIITNSNWCVKEVQYNSSVYYPQTLGFIKLSGEGFCEEELYFQSNGNIRFPGFQSLSANGSWKLDGNSNIIVTGTDTFDFLYNGTYNINLEGNVLTLRSDNTTIICSSAPKIGLRF